MKIEFFDDLFDSQYMANRSSWAALLQKQLNDIFNAPSHGHFTHWLSVIAKLSVLKTYHYKFDTPVVEIGTPNDIKDIDKDDIDKQLKSLLPWRKGPFNFFGIDVDSEWRCDKKWQRVQSIGTSLQNKTVLDVGCGNGYYMLRMLGDGANIVIGVDPTLIFSAQYYAMMQTIHNRQPAHLLPMNFEQLPISLNNFDIVFSMGVLYHRRDPIDHLKRLYMHTASGGRLVLETLIIDDQDNTELIPEERYAGMRNVWSIPSPKRLTQWLHRVGFENIYLANIQTTHLDEQRATQWTKNYSLENFLDPQDNSRTIEGYPAPTRAIITADKS